MQAVDLNVIRSSLMQSLDWQKIEYKLYFVLVKLMLREIIPTMVGGVAQW